MPQRIPTSRRPPLIFLNSEALGATQLALASFTGLVATAGQLLVAGSMIVLLPVLIVLVARQRCFVRGIVTTGLKGSACCKKSGATARRDPL